MIDGDKLVAKLEAMVKETKLMEAINKINSMDVNEEIRQRIERENTKEPKLIDAERLKINLNVYFGLKINQGHRQLDTVDTNTELAELVDRQPAVSDRWIPMSKRLPENEDDVIVTVQGYDGRSVEVDHYDLDFESWEMFSNPGEVIAWMPMPEPYREDTGMKYRKKPVTIEAFKYDGDLKDSDGRYYVPDWAVKAYEDGAMCYGEVDGQPGELFIKTLEGAHHVRAGDYIIKGVAGELYPCKPEIFEQTYDKLEE